MDDEVVVGEAEQEGVSMNGVSMNGVSMNGVSMNGTSLAGQTLSGVLLNGVAANGATIRAVSSPSATALAGTGPIGSTWNGVTSSGVTVKLRIDSAQQGMGLNTDLWFYGVSYQTQAGWTPMCGTDLAVPVAGVWGTYATYAASPTQFTFACRTKTIAKCVELGYKPYRGYSNQLASCVRLLRGDYCGTGIAYTADGTTLNLYDNVGVQADTQPWALEGEWGPNGARCVSNIVTTRFITRHQAVPSCVAALVSTSCGTFRTGTYLLDELQ